jgi:hypothetical protein
MSGHVRDRHGLTGTSRLGSVNIKNPHEQPSQSDPRKDPSHLVVRIIFVEVWCFRIVHGAKEEPNQVPCVEKYL